MKQSQIDLLAAMAGFRKFSKKLSCNSAASAAAHGVEKTSVVMDKVELVLENLLDLYMEMYPEAMPPEGYHEVECILLMKKVQNLEQE